MAAFLFFAVVLIWGTTWYAIHMQVAVTDANTAIFWRFLVASALLSAWLKLSGKWKAVPRQDIPLLALLGATMFSCNYMFMYRAEQSISSGTVSVVFSLAVIFNMLNQWLFFRIRPALHGVVGGVLAVAGVALMMGVTGASLTEIDGIALALGGTACFSIGNMISRHLLLKGLDLPTVVCRGMMWGCGFTGAWLLLTGHGLAGSWQPGWVASLLYLAVPGSIIGFVAYLRLVHVIGADRAAYTTILSPVVALVISSIAENSVWSASMGAGIALVLVGNLVSFFPWHKLKARV